MSDGTAYYHVQPQKPVVTHCPMCRGTGITPDTFLKNPPPCPFCEGGHVVTYPEPTYTATTTIPGKCAHGTTWTVDNGMTVWCSACGQQVKP